jgi:hypothetical protein
VPTPTPTLVPTPTPTPTPVPAFSTSSIWVLAGVMGMLVMLVVRRRRSPA